MSPDTSVDGPFTARCYCGKFTLHMDAVPLTVAYCHCTDCRRWTGAPVAAFAAFRHAALTAEPHLGDPRVHNPGVERWHCPDCGSPLAARFDYLPDQVYVPMGLIEQAADLPPRIHCHTASRLAWLHIDDTLERQRGTARTELNAAT